jgi:hypothetical protein
MGLDQYAYVAHKVGAYDEWSTQCDQLDASKPRDLAGWRKHPNLQGWMYNLWKAKNSLDSVDDSEFNNIELELTWQDIDQLEQDIKNGSMAALNTIGFFFGRHADEHYQATDLKFVRDARAELFMGLKVFYNSSW